VSSVSDILNEEKRAPVLASSPGEIRSPVALPVTVIERRPGWQALDVGELWRYRELLLFLTLRDIKVRYKQTVLGAAWAILQPLATMLVFSLFFGKVAASRSSDVPYSLFALAGLVPWMFFSNAIGTAGQSVVGSQNLVTKVYFPRLMIPMGSVAAGLIDFAIAWAMLLIVMVFYGVPWGWGMVVAPWIVLGLVVAALGVGVLLSALTVAYRDFRHVVPFMVQFWMFATPCIYLQQEAAVGSWGQFLLPLNPAYGLIANFRAAVLGTPFDLHSLAISTIVSLVLLLIGCLYFRRVEHGFADII
jgi:lipopolysaccharide transport system permease protein